MTPFALLTGLILAILTIALLGWLWNGIAWAWRRCKHGTGESVFTEKDE